MTFDDHPFPDLLLDGAVPYVDSKKKKKKCIIKLTPRSPTSTTDLVETMPVSRMQQHRLNYATISRAGCDPPEGIFIKNNNEEENDPMVELVPSEDLFEDEDGSQINNSSMEGERIMVRDNHDLVNNNNQDGFQSDKVVGNMSSNPTIKQELYANSQTTKKRDFIDEIGLDSFTGKEDVPNTDDNILVTNQNNHQEEILANVEIQGLQIVDAGFCSKSNDDNSSISSMNVLSATDIVDEQEGDDDNKIIETDDQDSVQSSVSADAASLLHRAQDRIARQKMTEDIQLLKEIVERKNSELELMAGQLRRAVETKCDLVVAHQELEKSHAYAIQKKNENLIRMKDANKCLLEGYAATEKKMLNEMIALNEKIELLEKKHMQELDDWERMHRNEMLEKDYEIAKLSEQLRAMRQYDSERPRLPM